MFCNKCGARLGQGETYCNRCGAPVRSSQVEQTQLIYDTQTPAPAPPYQDSCQQQAVPRTNALTPILAALCGVLVMVFVALCLVMGGVIHIGGSDATTEATVEAEASSSESTSASATAKDETESSAAKADEEEDTSQSQGTSQSQTPTQTTTTTTSTVTPQAAPEPEPVPETSTITTNNAANSGYVLPDSNSRYYSQSELSGYSNWELYIARNEIYARHGRKFRKEDLREHFKSCSWYQELYDPGYFEEHIEPTFNDYERKNADTIKAVETSRNSPYLG